MLVYKEPEESLTNKVLYYGILFIITVYMAKFLKFMAGQRLDCPFLREGLRVCNIAPNFNPFNKPEGNNEERKHRKRQRRKRHNIRVLQDQWSSDKPCYIREIEDNQ
ncbi:unnamed protein product [Colias eurytheme]|nr:unnamed protein product [Colias eurytheme]